MQSAPCRRAGCCICEGPRCDQTYCQTCFAHPPGKPLIKLYTCRKGSCPGCGAVYVEWLNFDQGDAVRGRQSRLLPGSSVVLNVEWDNDPAVRARWMGRARVTYR